MIIFNRLYSVLVPQRITLRFSFVFLHTKGNKIVVYLRLFPLEYGDSSTSQTYRPSFSILLPVNSVELAHSCIISIYMANQRPFVTHFITKKFFNSLFTTILYSKTFQQIKVMENVFIQLLLLYYEI